MAKAGIPSGRAAYYRLQAELARGKALTLEDAWARETMLEVARTLDELAAIEDRIAGTTTKDTEDEKP